MRIATMRVHSSGQWFVKIGGKNKYLGVDRETAEFRYRELIVEHYGTSKALQQCPENGVTVASLLTDYVKAVLAACSSEWVNKKQLLFDQITKHAIELYGELPAEDFGPKAYKAVRKAMAEEKGRGGDNVRRVTYINMLCTRLKAAWKWGCSEELVSESSYRRLLTVPDLGPGDLGLRDGREVLPVPQALFEQTLQFVSETCGDLLRLLWLTGARPSELINLTPAELLEDGSYFVYRPRDHKTKKMNKLRAIVFGAESIAILKRYWPKMPRERFFAVYSDATVVRNAIYRACVRGKLPRWHTYQLRHAAVTRIALEHGKEVAQAVAGHANVLTTDRYDHGAVERAKRAAG